MPLPTIGEVGTDANTIYTTLTTDLVLNLNLPEITVDLPLTFPDWPDEPADIEVTALTIEELTEGVVGGAGVFDSLMTAITAHLTLQHEKGRITGADYAKVYMGSINAVMQYGVQFLLGKDRVFLENKQIQAALRLAHTQHLKGLLDLQMAKVDLQRAQFMNSEARIKAYIARNQYADSKMGLVTSFQGIHTAIGQSKLVFEQYEAERGKTKNTLESGATITGLVGNEIMLSEARVQTQVEERDTIRAQTKDLILIDGVPTAVNGVIGIDKDLKLATVAEMENRALLTLEQVETQRAQTKETLTTGATIAGLTGLEKQIKTAQTVLSYQQAYAEMANVRDTLSAIAGDPSSGTFSPTVGGMVRAEIDLKAAQKDLTVEQVATQIAQTKDTLDGLLTPVAGIARAERELKEAQTKLVEEQYETQRAQTRELMSDGVTTIGGLTALEKKIKTAQVTQAYQAAYAQMANIKDVLVQIDGDPTLPFVSAVTGLMKYEKDLKAAQAKLVGEQYESQRGQTTDTRSPDGLNPNANITGILGAQRDLYKKQIWSYGRDAESKLAKMVLDTWTARKTLDDAVEPPVSITGPSGADQTSNIDNIVNDYKNNVQDPNAV